MFQSTDFSHSSFVSVMNIYVNGAHGGHERRKRKPRDQMEVPCPPQHALLSVITTSGVCNIEVCSLPTALLSPTSKPRPSPRLEDASSPRPRRHCIFREKKMSTLRLLLWSLSPLHMCVSLLVSVFRMFPSWQMALSPAAIAHQAM